MRKALTHAALAVGILMATTFHAVAEFPERRLQVSYPWGPGLPAYVVSQIIADGMAEELGVDVAVVARPGAGGVNAFMAGLAEPSDGYTIIDAYVAPLIISPIFDKADYTYEDFIPLHSATSNGFAIVSRADDDRWDDFPGLMKYMQDNPGELRFTAGEEFTLPHMVMSQIMKSYGAVARPVPYAGLVAGVPDLLGGLLDFQLINPGAYKSQGEAFKILAVLSELDEVQEIYGGAPKIAEFDVDIGLSGLAPMGWNWFVVENGTPDDVVQKLRDAMAASLANPEVQKKIDEIGFVPTGYSADEYDEVAGQIDQELRSSAEAVTWLREEVNKLN
ncbi:MAG: tripartite tricarboxylate transporter substrate binding protein [Pseudomonadota bacterium]